MTAVAAALAYLGTLAFAGFCMWWRAHYRASFRDQLVSLIQRIAALEHRRNHWNTAADYVEAEKLKNGFGPRKSTG